MVYSAVAPGHRSAFNSAGAGIAAFRLFHWRSERDHLKLFAQP
jgi:hypothetical protein